MIIYQGWVSPFSTKSRNLNEFVNEVLILINAYFLIVYSDFVVDPQVRYDMGWVNVIFLASLLAYNVGNMLIDTVRNAKKYLAKRKIRQEFQKV